MALDSYSAPRLTTSLVHVTSRGFSTFSSHGSMIRDAVEAAPRFSRSFFTLPVLRMFSSPGRLEIRNITRVLDPVLAFGFRS